MLRKNIYTTLGKSKMDSLNSINLTQELKPKTESHCQWAAIEAAKVLLDDEYKPQSLTDLPPTYQTDPVEDHLMSADKKSTKVPGLSCKNFSELQNALDKLNNGELYIVDGETDEITHAYILLKKEHRYWLI